MFIPLPAIMLSSPKNSITFCKNSIGGLKIVSTKFFSDSGNSSSSNLTTCPNVGYDFDCHEACPKPDDEQKQICYDVQLKKRQAML